MESEYTGIIFDFGHVYTVSTLDISEDSCSMLRLLRVFRLAFRVARFRDLGMLEEQFSEYVRAYSSFLRSQKTSSIPSHVMIKLVNILNPFDEYFAWSAEALRSFSAFEKWIYANKSISSVDLNNCTDALMKVKYI